MAWMPRSVPSGSSAELLLGGVVFQGNNATLSGGAVIARWEPGHRKEEREGGHDKQDSHKCLPLSLHPPTLLAAGTPLSLWSSAALTGTGLGTWEGPCTSRT